MPQSAIDQCDNRKVAAIIELYDSYIIDLARRYIPRNHIAREVLDLEIDELAQNTRIKLWNALCTKQIKAIKAYIKAIVRHGAIDMLRKYNTSSLALDKDGELPQGKLVGTGQVMQDPADEVEQAEALVECTFKAFDGVLTLPPRQQYAIACALKGHVFKKLGFHVVDFTPDFYHKGLHRYDMDLYIDDNSQRSLTDNGMNLLYQQQYYSVIRR